MHRLSAWIVQLIETCTIVAIGLALALVPQLFVWAFEQGFAGDVLAIWRISADVWLVGHGVDLTVSLSDAAVRSLGVSGAEAPFVVGLWPLGIGLLTFALFVRSGGRLARGAGAAAVRASEAAREAGTQPRSLTRVVAGTIGWGVLATLAVAVAVSLTLGLSALHPVVSPSLLQAATLPPLVMFAGLCVGIARHFPLDARSVFGEPFGELGMRLAAAGMRAGYAAVVSVLGLGALLFAVSLFANFADVVVLMESFSPTHLGVLVLTLVQLSLLPNAVIWASAWMLGPGFAVGTGSTVTPFGTELGPVPNLPMFAAIPAETWPVAGAVLVLPVLASIAIGALVRQRNMARNVDWWEPAAVAGIGAAAASAGLGVLALCAGGGFGPGRFAEAGPDAAAVVLWAFVALLVGLLIGLYLPMAAAAAGFVFGGEQSDAASAPARDASAAGGGADAPSSPAPDEDTRDVGDAVAAKESAREGGYGAGLHEAGERPDVREADTTDVSDLLRASAAEAERTDVLASAAEADTINLDALRPDAPDASDASARD